MSLFDYNAIGIGLIFFTALLGFAISRYFENIILRIIAVLIGLGFLSDGVNYDNIFAFALGSGIVLAHVKYFILSLIEFIQSTIALTYNMFTLGLAIYYKTRNFFTSIFRAYQKIKNFFTKQKYQEENEKHYYEEQKHENFYGNKENSRDNYGSNESTNENSYYEKQEYQYNYQYDNDENTNSYENNSQQEQKQQSNNHSKQEETKQKQSSSNSSSKSNNPYGAEYNQFYSDSMYTRLGVEFGVDKRTIKKAYRKLAMQFHPDKNRDKPDYKMYEEIFKLINEANMEIG